MFLALPLVVALVVVHALCVGPARAETLTIFAAASTKDAIEDLAARYAARHGDTVRTVFAASSTLAKQIAEGAPADLYLSANPAWMDYLAERDAIEHASRIDLLGNRLVLIVPRGGAAADAELGELTPASLATFLDATLAGDRPLAIADPRHVPAGLYAQAAFEALGQWPNLADRTVRTKDVRAALALVDRGEASAGVVYATDAAISSRVCIVGLFPLESHPAIVYPLAVVAGHGSAPVQAFYAYLRGEEVAAAFRARGFAAPPAARP